MSDPFKGFNLFDYLKSEILLFNYYFCEYNFDLVIKIVYFSF